MPVNGRMAAILFAASLLCPAHAEGVGAPATLLRGGSEAEGADPDPPTTGAPDDLETTEPPYSSGGSPVSIIETTVHDLWITLLNTPYQYANAVVALLLGLLMVFDGEAAFQWIVLCITFMICCILGMNEVSQFWHLPENGVGRHVVGIEIGALGAFVAWQGYQGVLVCVAWALGAITAQHMETGMEHLFGHVNKWVIISLYTIVILTFLVLVQKGAYVRFLIIICPFFGGSLVVSSFSFLFTLAAKTHNMGALSDHLAPEGGSWIQFLVMLWSSKAKDVGLFASDKFYFEVLRQPLQLDRLLGYVWWFVFFVAGVIVQHKLKAGRLTALRKAKKGAVAAESKEEPAKEELEKPLLADA